MPNVGTDIKNDHVCRQYALFKELNDTSFIGSKKKRQEIYVISQLTPVFAAKEAYLEFFIGVSKDLNKSS